MGSGRDLGKAVVEVKVARRRPGQVLHIGAVLPAVLRPAYRSAGPAAAVLLADWPHVVGVAIAAVTRPRKVSAGTLTVACHGPVAMEMQHLAPQLIERINLHLGGATVKRLRLVQEAGGRMGAGSSAGLAAVVMPRGASVPVAPMGDGGLEEALARLGGQVRGRG